jgi:hypothetical protein
MRAILKVAVLALLLISPVISKADSISENFNTLTPMLNATNIGAFMVTSGAVDVVGGTVFGYLCVAPESGNCVDLDGSTGAAGQISSANLSLGACPKISYLEGDPWREGVQIGLRSMVRAV